VFSNTVTKKELVEYISQVYDLNIVVNPKETEIQCDRSISSIYENEFEIPDLKEQLKELKEFSKSLYN
jgi:hypothetical protein